MHPLGTIGPLVPGDILHHPVEGFALVDRVESGLVSVVRDPAGLPARQTWERGALEDGWQLGTPWGFFTRLLRDPEGIQEQARHDPLRTLGELLDELGEPQTEDDLRAWLVGQGVIDEASYAPWWADARRRLDPASGLAWDGQHLSRATPPDPTAEPGAFLELAAPRQFQSWRAADRDQRAELLAAAIDAADSPAILLCLRSPDPLPDAHADAIRALAFDGDVWVLTALLSRLDEPAVRTCGRLARRPAQRSLLAAALDRLPPSARDEAGRAILECILTHHDADQEPAARFVAGALTAAADAATLEPDPDGPRDHRWPQARAWLDGDPASDPSLGGVPLSGAGPIAAAELFDAGLRLAQALAARHAAGAYGGVRDALQRHDGTIALGPPTPGDPRDDVRDAMRLLAERAIGRLPAGDRVRHDDLTVHWAQLVPDAPLEWAAVLARALSPAPGLRPANGLDLWEQLAQAQAIHQVRAAAPSRPRAHVEIGHDTHIGAIKSRLGQTNQDALFWQSEGDLSLLVVADGISTSTAGSGDLAAGLLVQTFARSWPEHLDHLSACTLDEIESYLVDTLAQANRSVCERSLQLAGGDLRQHIPMGTTVLACVLRGADAVLASLGDSRAYLVTSAGAAPLTGDQNVRGEWLRGHQKGNSPGLLNEGYALVGYVGHFDELARPTPAPPALTRLTLLPGELLGLCTDGVTDYGASSPAEAAMLFEDAARADTLSEACRDLVGRANAGGGGDNITVVLARVHG